ncbi:30S ribosomal protein S17 [archaeon CG_4_10_14_0_2_um_filter_Archaea_38_6]|nr:MAG: 30S ribosomal protein S17 [archaeon CG_4_10_14_0_2_um_filter_Archaea_38_6]
MGRNLGIKGIEAPEKECSDNNCPFHGSLRVRGRIFRGKVVNDKMSKGVTIKFERIYKIPKFERFARKNTKIKAHNPECINAKLGDEVTIMETRPISKTISFVVIKKEKMI